MKKFIKLTKLPITESKKYKATFLVVNKEGKEKEKVVRFGAQGYRDYTLMNQKGNKFYEPLENERKKVRSNYLGRHEKNEDWNNVLSAGSLSRWILWNKPKIGDSLQSFIKKFKL